MALTKIQKRERIKRRIKSNLVTSSERPRLSVFRSNKEIYAQIIDDEKNITIVSASSYIKGSEKVTKIEQAKKVGALIADKAKSLGVESVVFDRNGYVYHGRVKALAEAARENGLKF